MSPSNVFQSRALLNRDGEWILHIFAPDSHSEMPVDNSDASQMWLAAQTVPSAFLETVVRADFISILHELF